MTTQKFRIVREASPYLLNPPITSSTATLNFLLSRLPFSALSTLGDICTERFVEFHEPI